MGTTQTHAMRFHRITFSKSVPVFVTVFALAIVDPSHAATKKRSVKRVPPTTTVKKAIAKAPIPTTVQPVAAATTNTAISTETPPASPAKAPKFREFYYIQVSNVRNTLFLDGTNTVSNSTIRISGCSQELPVACKAEFATNAKPIVANGPFGSLRLQTIISGSLSQEIDSFERDFLCYRFYYKTKFKLSRIVSVNNLTFDSDGFVSGFNGAWERVDTLLDPKPQDCGARK